MKITIEIPAKRIADIMCSAVEHNHMTTAWCAGVIPKGETAKIAGNWYAEDETYENGFLFDVLEVLDESKAPEGDNIKRHRVGPAEMADGIAYMAAKHGSHFGDWMAENDDAITADVFLQCIALREVIYG